MRAGDLAAAPAAPEVNPAIGAPLWRVDAAFELADGEACEEHFADVAMPVALSANCMVAISHALVSTIRGLRINTGGVASLSLFGGDTNASFRWQFAHFSIEMDRSGSEGRGIERNRHPRKPHES
jgi:hypothetical protein